MSRSVILGGRSIRCILVISGILSVGLLSIYHLRLSKEVCIMRKLISGQSEYWLSSCILAALRLISPIPLISTKLYNIHSYVGHRIN